MATTKSNQTVSLVLDLNPKGDGGAYHIKNTPGEINRKHISDRGNNMVVQADLIAVVHGRLVDQESPDGAPATLIVTDFRFFPREGTRRFTWAKITYKFDGLSRKLGGNGGAGPIVHKIAPKGKFSLHPVPVHIEKGWTAEANVEAPAGPVNPGTSIGWERKKTFDTKDQIALSGMMRLEGRDFGEPNTAIWTMKENKTTSSGIPSRLRTSILLKRKPLEPKTKFQATVDIEVDADMVSQLGMVVRRVLGQVPKDDPVVFDPQASMARDGFDAGAVNINLSKEDLEGHCLVETSTVLRGDGTLAAAVDGPPEPANDGGTAEETQNGADSVTT